MSKTDTKISSDDRIILAIARMDESEARVNQTRRYYASAKSEMAAAKTYGNEDQATSAANTFIHATHAYTHSLNDHAHNVSVHAILLTNV